MTNYLDTVTMFRRAKKGRTYHRAECLRAGNTLPWIWAEGRSREEIEASHANGLRPCKVCDPLGAFK